MNLIIALIFSSSAIQKPKIQKEEEQIKLYCLGFIIDFHSLFIDIQWKPVVL